MKELEDYKWFPNTLRNYQTEYIGFVVKQFNIYKPFVKTLPKQMDKTMFDLCSGSGEPAASIFVESNAFKHLTLTDKYPFAYYQNGANINYIQESLDVLKIEFKAGNTYTMFNAFHHFSEDEQRVICSKIIEAKADAFFVEILFPNPLQLAKILTATTLGVLFLTPFTKPFSWKKLFFTYIIPINILTISIDGIISVFKSKTVKQYQRTLNNNRVNVYEIKSFLAPLLVIQINESN
jgi:hypothetical protein